MKNNKIIERIIWILLLAIVWELVVLTGRFSTLILPSLRSILHSLYLSISRGDLLAQIYFSMSIIIQGIIISLIIAMVLVFLSLFSKVFTSLLETIIAIAHPLPGIALLPLVILWMGAGRKAILFIIIHSVLWPLVLNLKTGFQSIPEVYKLIGKNYELNKLQIMIKILTPASFPYFLAGMKIGWARAWRALISAEMLFGAANSIGGLGWFIFEKRSFFDLPGVFAGIIVIVIIGILIEDFVFQSIENHTIKKWGMST
ncbi:MAG: ABC transporter permease subunit [Halanaerobiales bacterium]|nr:ABC transporter permease subunit [Halanaerobiales bacterium]